MIEVIPAIPGRMFFWAGAGEFRAGRGEWPLAGVAVAGCGPTGGLGSSLGSRCIGVLSGFGSPDRAAGWPRREP